MSHTRYNSSVSNYCQVFLLKNTTVERLNPHIQNSHLRCKSTDASPLSVLQALLLKIPGQRAQFSPV